MSHDPNEPTPVPYEPGKLLELEVLQNCSNFPLSESITAAISKVITITMSSVMEVTFKTDSGTEMHAILKLYDRRFGEDLRVERKHKHKPQKRGDEMLFQSNVRKGHMDQIIQQLEVDKEEDGTLPYEYLDGSTTGVVKYEGAMWQICNAFFQCETDAYAQLKELQGKSIPHLYAHVQLSILEPDISQEAQYPQMKSYSKVKGILLELISGYSLRDMPTSPLAPKDLQECTEIVQKCVDAAHDINRCGIIVDDCQPRNAMVAKDSQTPFIIDLADCQFKDKLIEENMKNRAESSGENVREIDTEEEVGEFDPEVFYWELARMRDNHGAIGSLMSLRFRHEWFKKKKNFHLDIKYPDLDKIIQGLKTRKEDCLGMDEHGYVGTDEAEQTTCTLD